MFQVFSQSSCKATLTDCQCIALPQPLADLVCPTAWTELIFLRHWGRVFDDYPTAAWFADFNAAADEHGRPEFLDLTADSLRALSNSVRQWHVQLQKVQLLLLCSLMIMMTSCA